MSLELQFSEIVSLIVQAKNKAFQAVNKEAILLNWKVGEYVSIKLKSASWGDGVVEQLADFLKKQDPTLKGFSKRGIYRMVQFYETYSNNAFLIAVSPQLKIIGNSIVSSVTTQNENIDNELDVFVSSVMTQITWTHHLEILVSCNSAEEKMFYLLMTKKERWSVRDLRRQIKAATYERTMLASQQVEQIQKHFQLDISHVFRDSYVFEFLNMPELHSEQTLCKTLIKNLSAFIKELGNDFLFMGEEFKLTVGMLDFYFDLLFFHRDLQCLVAFELKTETFTTQSLAQINFYLEALDRDVKKPNENPSIGIQSHSCCKYIQDKIFKLTGILLSDFDFIDIKDITILPIWTYDTAEKFIAIDQRKKLLSTIQTEIAPIKGYFAYEIQQKEWGMKHELNYGKYDDLPF